MSPDPQKTAPAKGKSLPLPSTRPAKTSRGYQVQFVASDPPTFTVTYFGEEGSKALPPPSVTCNGIDDDCDGVIGEEGSKALPPPSVTVQGPRTTKTWTGLDMAFKAFKVVDKALTKLDIFLLIMLGLFIVVKRFRAANSRLGAFMKKAHFHYEKKVVASYGKPENEKTSNEKETVHGH